MAYLLIPIALDIKFNLNYGGNTNIQTIASLMLDTKAEQKDTIFFFFIVCFCTLYNLHVLSIKTSFIRILLIAPTPLRQWHSTFNPHKDHLGYCLRGGSSCLTHLLRDCDVLIWAVAQKCALIAPFWNITPKVSTSWISFFH